MNALKCVLSIGGFILIMVFCMVWKLEANEFFVSQSGSDSWSGTLALPNENQTDGPFATLDGARTALRSLVMKVSLPAGGITISIRGGTYRIGETFELGELDSGTEFSPIVWRAYPGEEVRFLGGAEVNGFERVKNPEVLARIDERFRDNIVQANLREKGITSYGSIDPETGDRIELYFRKKFMTIARYPNDGWLNISDVPQTGPRMINEGLDRDKSAVPRGRHYGRFSCNDSRADRWKESRDIWMHGYWVWDWQDDYLEVAKIDKENGDIYPKEPHHSYGYFKGQRFYFVNILEELDAPGEWYLDSGSGILYFYPPAAEIRDGDVTMSLEKEPMIALSGSSYLTLSGFTFECSRGSAVTITGGVNNVIAGCTFRNLGGTAVTIDGGEKNGVQSCDIFDVGSGGVILNGGDHLSLAPSGNFADNNHIHDYSIRLKTYTPAVQITGVGNKASHNYIHDAPHIGIFLATSNVGNDNVVEFNELHSLAKETGDVGAIYLCSRNYTFRGNIVRHNYIHHLIGPGEQGVMGVYLDDFTSETTVYGNVFYKSGRSGFIGGGRDNVIENNIFVDCEPSVHLDARGLGWAKYYFEQNMQNFISQMNEVRYKEPPYSERYPALLNLLDDEPAVPKYNKILRNVSFGGRWFDLFDRLEFSQFEMKDNYIADPVLCRWLRKGEKGFINYNIGDPAIMKELEGNILSEKDPGFMDVQNENFQLRPDSPAFKLGFKRIPIEEIGLYKDAYRPSLPKSE